MALIVWTNSWSGKFCLWRNLYYEKRGKRYLWSFQKYGSNQRIVPKSKGRNYGDGKSIWSSVDSLIQKRKAVERQVPKQQLSPSTIVISNNSRSRGKVKRRLTVLFGNKVVVGSGSVKGGGIGTKTRQGRKVGSQWVGRKSSQFDIWLYSTRPSLVTIAF